MVYDWTIKMTDVAIMAATFLGPIFAVQLQKYIERRGAEEQRQVGIFRTVLISPPLSYVSVQALNGIKVEFRRVKAVIAAWDLYIDHITPRNGVFGSDEKRVELYVDLLFQMSEHLGYGLGKVTLKNGFYSPVIHGEIEKDEQAIRKGLIGVFSGQVPISMDVKAMPVDKEAFKEFGVLRQMLIAWLTKNGVERPPEGR